VIVPHRSHLFAWGASAAEVVVVALFGQHGLSGENHKAFAGVVGGAKPQCGQLTAVSETSFRHSGHLINMAVILVLRRTATGKRKGANLTHPP
jgi:hypothetical protein